MIEFFCGMCEVIDVVIVNGIMFFDIVDMYGVEFGVSEMLMGEVFEGCCDCIVFVMKFG